MSRPRPLLAVLALLAALSCLTAVGAATSASASTKTAGGRALDWAEAHALGHAYAYGGTGPAYDCSGIVSVSFRHAGISLPHNTVAMIRSGHLVRTWHPRRGDLAFWGPIGAPYHVEWTTIWPHTTFGAHHSGTTAGWRSYSPGWAPSAFYRVVR